MSVKTVLFNALQGVIGDLIVGFTADKLKVGLWSGKIELDNLEVNVEAARKLGLPVRIIFGKVARLSVSIPWTALGSQPVRIFIRGVSVLAAPEASPADSADLAKELGDALAARLEGADAAFLAKLDAGDDGAKGGKYYEKFVAKIVDNLEVSVEDAHVRLEDGGDFACGFVLRSFVARAADASWAAAFVERSGDALLRNLVSLQGVACYWDDANAGAGDDPETFLQGEIPREGSGAPANWVLAPLDGALRLTRNEAFKEGFPQYDVGLEVGGDAGAAFTLKAASAKKLLAFFKRADLLARQRQLAHLHPKAVLGDRARPVARGECARAWWTYALRLACPRYAERARQREALRHFGAIRERDRYTALFEAASDGEAAADRDERRAVERQAPFEVLCLWRQRSLLARRRERKRSDATERSKKWWRWGSRGAADAADDDDDVRHEDLEALFHVDDEAAAAPRGFEILRLRALTGARVALEGPAGPVGELAVAAEIAATATADFESLHVDAKLTEFGFADRTGALARSGVPGGFVVAPRGTASDCPVKLEVARTKAGELYPIVATLDCDAYGFAYHRPWIDGFLEAFVTDVFKDDDLATAAAAAKDALLEAATEALAKRDVSTAASRADEFAGAPKSFTLKANVGAPALVVPRSWAEDRGRVVVDMGTCALGGAVADVGQRWDLDLRNATLRLFASAAGAGRDVVAPFGLKAAVDVFDGAPLDVDLALTGDLALTLAPADATALLEVAAALGGAGGDEVAEAEAALERDVLDVLETLEDDMVKPSATRLATLDVRAAVANLEIVVLTDDGDRVYCLAARGVAASFRTFDAGGLELDATLRELSLTEAASGAVLLESFGDAASEAAAAAAGRAFRALPTARSQNLDVRDSLVAFSLRTFEGFEDGFQSFHTDCEIAFASVRLATSGENLRPLKPFWDGIQRGLEAFGGPAPPPVEDTAASPAAAAAEEPRALRVALRLGEVAIVLTDGGVDVAAAAVTGGAVVWTSAGVVADAAVRLANLRLTDARPSSEGRAFREMVVPWASGDNESGRALDALLAMSSGDALVELPADDLLLAVDYRDEGGHKSVSASAHPVTVQLHREPIAAGLSAVLELKDALVYVFASGRADEAAAAPAAAASDDAAESELVVQVELRAAEVLLLEDAGARTTRALAMRFGAGYTYSNRTRGRHAEVVTSAAVHHLAASLAEDGLGAALHRLVAPTTVSFRLEKQFDGEIMYDSKVDAHVSDVDVRASYRDLISVCAVLRGALNDGGPAATTEEGVAETTATAAAKPAAGRVVTARYEAHLVGCRVVLVDDSRGPAVPLLDATLRHVDASLRGPTTALEGGASLELTAKCFNPDCLRFEPLLETYALRCRLDAALDDATGGLDSLTVDLASDDVLDATLSTSFVARLLELETQLVKTVTSKADGGASLIARRDEPALRVRNETLKALEIRPATGAWRPFPPRGAVALGREGGRGDAASMDLPAAVDVRGEGLDFSGLVASAPCHVAVGGGLMWVVAFDERSGVVSGVLRSRVVVRNFLPCAFDVARSDAPQAPAEAPGGGAETPLPLRLAEDGAALFFRRADDGFEYGGGEPLRAWGGGGGQGARKKRLVVSKRPGEAAVAVVGAASDNGEAVVTLHPPVTVENRLPCGVLVTLQVGSRGESRVRVAPGGRGSVVDVDVSGGVWVSLRVGAFKGRCDAKIVPKSCPRRSGDRPSATSRGVHDVLLGDDGERHATVGVRCEKRHRGLGLAIILESPLWAVDKTGLGLDLAAAPGRPRPDAASLRGRLLKKKSVRRASALVADGRHFVAVPEALAPFVASARVASPRKHEILERPPAAAYADEKLYTFHALPPPLDAALYLPTQHAERNPTQMTGNAAEKVFGGLGRALKGQSSVAAPPGRYLTLEAGSRGLDVYVALDARAAKPPRWLVERFARATDAGAVVVEKRRHALSLEQAPDLRSFAVWKHSLAPGDTCDLGYNEEKSMYLVFLGRPASKRRASAVSPEDAAAGSWAYDSWPGYDWLDPDVSHQALLHSYDGHLAAGSGGAWSARYVVGAARFPVDLRDGARRFELEARPVTLKGVFGAGAGLAVELAPRFALWNVDDEATIVARQAGGSREGWLGLERRGDRAKPWHWPDADRPKVLEFGVLQDDGDVCWSCGSLAIDNLGGHALLLRDLATVARVEVRVNESTHRPPFEAVTVRVCVDRLGHRPLFLAKNDSKHRLALYHGARPLGDVLPGAERPFGWADAASKRVLTVQFPDLPGAPTGGDVDADAVNAAGREVLRGVLESSATVADGSRVVRFGDAGAFFDEPDPEPEARGTRTFTATLGGCAVHVVHGRGAARSELACAHLRTVRLKMARSGDADEFEARVKTFQVDNHCADARWPALVNGTQEDHVARLARQTSSLVGLDDDAATPDMVEVAAVYNTHAGTTPTLKYLAARALPVEVFGDANSLSKLKLAADAVGDALHADAHVDDDPEAWAQNLVDAAKDPKDVADERAVALRPRGVVEALVLHPVALTVSFAPPAPGGPDDDDDDENAFSTLAVVSNLAELDRAEVRLKSFAVENAVEEPHDLARKIGRHYATTLVFQLHKVVGSLASLGQPANLVGTIGNGVKEFFYAPARGVVQSPKAFAQGVYSGTTGLAASVVGGVGSSVSGVSQAISQNVSLLSGDADFLREREARRRNHRDQASAHAEQYGAAGAAASGVFGGAAAIVGGVADGVGGIFTKPVEGAQRDGALGFFKGVAKGIAGVAVKPVVGVLDGASVILDGVSQGAVATPLARHVGPPKSLVRLPNSEHLVLAGSAGLG